MNAALLMLIVLAALLLPGVILGHSREPLSLKLWTKIFVGQSLFFLSLSLLLKLFPLLFDPRLSLW